ncbi:MAG TPA: radical SAM protein [Candidatus Bathyarchaeia archaeon]|nr:radical SAM protein [Candidatus Bathyarchaeia archaeon]
MSFFATIKARVKTALWPLLPASYRARRIALATPAHYPHHVYFEPTTRCNLGCLFCRRTHWKARDKQRDFSIDMFKKAATELREAGVAGLTLQNLGEPLMYPNIIEVVEFAKGLGFATRFNTNLTLLTEDAVERLVRCGHDEILVSIDSYDPAVFNDLRRGTTLEKVLANLRILCETKRRLASPTPQIHVSAVLMRATLAKTSEFIAAMKSMGVNSMNFQEVNTDGLDLDTVFQDGSTLRENALQNMPRDELRAALAKIKACQDKDFPISVPGDWSGCKTSGRQGPGILTCAELWETSSVDSAGLVTPCCWQPDGSLINLGNLNTQSFKEIWFGEPYERLRRQHLSNRHPPFCQVCQQLFYTVAVPSPLTLNRQPARPYTRVFLGRA